MYCPYAKRFSTTTTTTTTVVMFRLVVAKAAAPVVALRFSCAASVPRVAATAIGHRQQRSFSSATEDEEVVKVVLSDSLEWALSSPPPIHQFDESPIIVEIGEE